MSYRWISLAAAAAVVTVPALASAQQTSMHAWAVTLAIAILVNSAISAAYYLGIVATLFARAEPAAAAEARPGERLHSTGVTIGTVACAVLIVILGVLPGVVGRIDERVDVAAESLGDPLVQAGVRAAAVAPAPGH